MTVVAFGDIYTNILEIIANDSDANKDKANVFLSAESPGNLMCNDVKKLLTEARDVGDNHFGGFTGQHEPWIETPIKPGDKIKTDSERANWIKANCLDAGPNHYNVTVDDTPIIAAYYTIRDGVEVCHHTYQLRKNNKIVPVKYNYVDYPLLITMLYQVPC